MKGKQPQATEVFDNNDHNIQCKIIFNNEQVSNHKVHIDLDVNLLRIKVGNYQ